MQVAADDHSGAGGDRRFQLAAVHGDEAFPTLIDDCRYRARDLQVADRQGVLIIADRRAALAGQPYMVEGQAVFGLRCRDPGVEAVDGQQAIEKASQFLISAFIGRTKLTTCAPAYKASRQTIPNPS